MRARSNNDQRKADFRRGTRSQCLGGSLLSKRYVVQQTLWNITREIEISRKRWTSLNTSGQCPVGKITSRELFRGKNHFWRPSLPTACRSVEPCEILDFSNNSARFPLNLIKVGRITAFLTMFCPRPWLSPSFSLALSQFSRNQVNFLFLPDKCRTTSYTLFPKKDTFFWGNDIISRTTRWLLLNTGTTFNLLLPLFLVIFGLLLGSQEIFWAWLVCFW